MFAKSILFIKYKSTESPRLWLMRRAELLLTSPRPLSVRAKLVDVISEH